MFTKSAEKCHLETRDKIVHSTKAVKLTKRCSHESLTAIWMKLSWTVTSFSFSMILAERCHLGFRINMTRVCGNRAEVSVIFYFFGKLKWSQRIIVKWFMIQKCSDHLQDSSIWFFEISVSSFCENCHKNCICSGTKTYWNRNFHHAIRIYHPQDNNGAKTITRTLLGVLCKKCVVQKVNVLDQVFGAFVIAWAFEKLWILIVHKSLEWCWGF